MLTSQEIDALFDEHGWSPSTMYYPVVSAIEQVATAPLLARIAELEAELEKTKASFASLVAAAEREACAQIVEKNAELCVTNRAIHDVLHASAVAIRARGEA